MMLKTLHRYGAAEMGNPPELRFKVGDAVIDRNGFSIGVVLQRFIDGHIHVGMVDGRYLTDRDDRFIPAPPNAEITDDYLRSVMTQHAPTDTGLIPFTLRFRELDRVKPYRCSYDEGCKNDALYKVKLADTEKGYVYNVCYSCTSKVIKLAARLARPVPSMESEGL